MMNEYTNYPQGPFPNPKEWKSVDELIHAISSDAVWDDPEAMSQPLIEYPATESDLQFFHSTVRRYEERRRRNHTSIVERWAIEQSQINWLAKLQERLTSIHTAHERTWENIRGYFQSLQETIDVLSQRMIPAPVHRSAMAAKEQIYQPRRRALEPADLPAFPALFCTAIDPDAQPFTISGLKCAAAHRFTLTCVQNPSLTHEETIDASENGQVQIDIAKKLAALNSQHEGFSEFVWVLSEDVKGGAWTSGLVWLESKATRKLAGDAVRVLMESEEKERPESCIDALFEINLLSTREFFMEAYEQARQGLLFLPRQYREENSVPFKESLWLFVNHLVDKVLARLEKAEPVFRNIKADWNAVQSLRLLKNRLKEWE